MMMSDKKKIAMLIIGGLKNSDANKGEGSSPIKQSEVKTQSENEESEDSRTGLELAVEKLFKAFETKDIKKGVEALQEFKDCSEGEHYSMEPSKSMFED